MESRIHKPLKQGAFGLRKQALSLQMSALVLRAPLKLRTNSSAQSKDPGEVIVAPPSLCMETIKATH